MTYPNPTLGLSPPQGAALPQGQMRGGQFGRMVNEVRFQDQNGEMSRPRGQTSMQTIPNREGFPPNGPLVPNIVSQTQGLVNGDPIRQMPPPINGGWNTGSGANMVYNPAHNGFILCNDSGKGGMNGGINHNGAFNNQDGINSTNGHNGYGGTGGVNTSDGLNRANLHNSDYGTNARDNNACTGGVNVNAYNNVFGRDGGAQAHRNNIQNGFYGISNDHVHNNAEGFRTDGYNLHSVSNEATNAANGFSYNNGMFAPSVTNGGFGRNPMNENVNGNYVYPNQVVNEAVNWNANIGFHGAMGGSQAIPNISTTQVPLTPAEREIKELREMLLKFMNKDGLNLQALNFQEMAVLPQKFKMPEIKRFNGIGCPTSHLKSYTLAMKTRGATPQLMAANFPLTLEGSAQEWIMTLDPSILIDWEKVTELFQRRYMDNSKRGNDKKELKNFCMKDGESFTDFVKRWKNKVAQTLERPTKDEEMDMFLNNLKPFYFHKMICGGYSDFDALMSAGLRMEECLRLGTMKDDTPASGNSHRYRSTANIGANKASNDSSPAHNVSHINWTQFAGGNSNQQTRAQIPYNYVNTIGKGTNPRGGYRNNTREERPPRVYDVLPESQATVFNLLKERGVMKPMEGWKPRTDPLPPNWDHGKYCEYHNFSGHDTEGCFTLKNHLQDLIDRGVLEKGAKPGHGPPNTVNNPLPAN